MRTSIQPDYDPTQRNQAGSATAIPRPETPVSVAINGIRKRICDLAHTIDQMEDKLQPALRPEPVQMQPAAVGNLPKTVQAESELTQQIREQDELLDRLICRLNFLRDRVEI